MLLQYVYFNSECLLLAGSAHRASLPVLFLLTDQFLGFSPQRIKVKFGRGERTVLPAKFHLYGPQNLKFLEFYQYNCP